MRKILSIFTISFCASLSFAGTQDFTFPSYKAASLAPTYVRFEMASTKFGVLTTNFTGFLRKFTLTGSIEKNRVNSGAKIDFLVTDLDTDIDGRNEKMWTVCLDSKIHPSGSITLDAPIPINGVESEIPARLHIRGQDHNLKLLVTAAVHGETVMFDIKGETSIKALSIPDPSIVIASVRDRIELKSHIEFSTK